MWCNGPGLVMRLFGGVERPRYGVGAMGMRLEASCHILSRYCTAEGAAQIAERGFDAGSPVVCVDVEQIGRGDV